MEEVSVFPLQISPKVIQHISSTMYRSPSSAIKELLINSFDAEATEVELKLLFGSDGLGGPTLKEIQVTDNGEGMDGNKLHKVFTEIGDSLKSRSVSDPNSDILTEHLKRPMVGRLGIGILAIASATSGFKVVTKKKDSDLEFTAEVTIKQFDQNLEKIAAIEDFPMGKVTLNSSVSKLKTESFTKVIINNFKPPFMSLINRKLQESFLFRIPFKVRHSGSIGEEENYFRQLLYKFYREERISNLPQLDKMIVQIGNAIPVSYLSDGPVRRKFPFDGKVYEIPNANGEIIASIKKKLEDYNFNVKITVDDPDRDFHNTFRLFKPQRFPTDNDLALWKKRKLTIEQLKPNILEFSQEADIGYSGKAHPIEIKGYLYHQNARINPREYRGLLYRVYNVAIGDEYKDDLRIYSNNPIALHQISIEIYLNKGFQSVVNIDRESFYEAGDSFQYLKAYLEHILSGRGNLTEEVEKAAIPTAKVTTTSEVKVDTGEFTATPHPPIYEKIFADFGMANPKPLLSTVKADMKTGLDEKRRIKSERMVSDLTSEFLRKNKVVQSSKIIYSARSNGAKLVIGEGVAQFSIPEISGSYKELAQQIIKLMLLINLKDNHSLVSQKYITLLLKILDNHVRLS